MKRPEKVHGLLRRPCPSGTGDFGGMRLCRGLRMEREMAMSNPSPIGQAVDRDDAARQTSWLPVRGCDARNSVCISSASSATRHLPSSRCQTGIFTEDEVTFLR